MTTATSQWNSIAAQGKSKQRLLSLGILLLTVLCAGRQIASWPARLMYPGDGNAGGDSMPLTDTVHLAQGLPIYAPYTGQRYDAANWGPLFYLLGSRVVNPEQPAYLPLRLLAITGMLGCTVCCALLAFWYARSKLAALMAALLFLSYGFVSWFGTSSRPDTMELLLVSVGFLVAYRFRDSSRLLLAAPFFLVALFYKPQYVAGSLAVMIFLLRERQYRRAAQLAATLVLGGTALLLLFQFVVFPGQAFFSHFITYNLLPFTWEDYAPQFLFFCMALLVPLLLSLQSLKNSPDRLLSCYIATAALLPLATIGRPGSERYYFFELAFLESVLVAALMTRVIRQGEVDAAVGVLFLVTLLGVQTGPPAPDAEATSRDRAVQEYLRSRFPRQTPALGYFSGDLMRAGLDARISNLFHYTRLVHKGTFSDSGLVGQIQGHAFGVVVLVFDLNSSGDQALADFYLTRPVQAAIKSNYRLGTAFPEAHFYAWVPDAAAKPAPAGTP